ncbi:hypothetical protein DPMN_061936 [Dreissena polymorpha]|uniref:Uncharacterized protein n=1 Tax=Dreissena polymorpha TaxID=45954 RepID=A0A9D4HHC2_DREPO|nr:hypothetical protein DPMN_061936 [Dreissena polymorpha]
MVFHENQITECFPGIRRLKGVVPDDDYKPDWRMSFHVDQHLRLSCSGRTCYSCSTSRQMGSSIRRHLGQTACILRSVSA